MKALNSLLLSLLFTLFTFTSFAQDSLFHADLAPHVYHFDIVDNKIVGEGADFLNKEIEQIQYLLIGEYHGSPRISELTRALIPILNKNGFKTMALEIGPHAAEILKEISKEPNAIEQRLHAFHTQYGYIESDGYFNCAFPFFDHKEDAAFLKEAKEKDWDFFGLDQEYYNGFEPLIIEMYNGLSKKEQKELGPMKAQLVDSIIHYYEIEVQKDINLFVSLDKSKIFHDFISKAATTERNRSIKAALEKTIEIYSLSIIHREYLANNQTRVNYFKENFRKYIAKSNFDLSKDKMLIKMGAYHTSKGYNPLDVLDMGNFIFEVANLHGTQSRHLTFIPRFAIDEGQEMDMAQEEKDPFKLITQYGKKDQWTIVDTRVLKKGIFYYPIRYKLNKNLVTKLLQHDYILIPKLDTEGTKNFDKTKIHQILEE